MKLIFFLILSCLALAQEVRFQKDGDTTNIYNTGLTTPAEIVAGRKNMDSLFLNTARFKDNVTMDSTAIFNNGIKLGANDITYSFPFVSVGDYGAVGDGVTDDFTAIQKAIDSCAGEKTLIIGGSRSDTFIVSQPLYLRSNSDYIINGTVKLMDGDSSALTVNAGVGAISFTVADGSKFNVGQWVAVSDTQTVGAYIYVRGAWRSATGKIASIVGNVVTLADSVHPCASCPDKTFTITKNAMLSHFQNVFIVEDVDNVTISGSGLIDANRNNQKQVWGFMPDGSEEQRAGCGLTARNVKNFFIDGLEFRNGLLHNLTITADETTPTILNKNIRLNNIKAVNGHDKNIILRYTDGAWVTNITADSATYEDGLIFYSYDTNCFAENIIVRGNGRYGFAYNSNVNQYLNADNIKTSGNADNGVFVSAKNVNMSNLMMTDKLAISSAYTCKDINLANITLQGVAGGNGVNDAAVLQIGGSVQRLNISNLNIEGCSGTGIYIANTTNVNQEIKITGGGIFNQTNTKTNIDLDANVKFKNFAGLEERLYNGDMETDTLWVGSGTEAGDTTRQSSTVKHSGTYSWYSHTNGVLEGIISPIIYLDSNRVYEVSLWVYPLAADSGIQIADVSNRWQIDTVLSLTLNQWSNVSLNVTADSTNTDYLLIRSGGSSGTPQTRFYIDDVSVRLPYNSGTATITSGVDSVIVPHYQYTAPLVQEILITPQSNLGGRSYYVDPDEITSTTFTIRLSGNAVADYKFTWVIE